MRLTSAKKRFAAGLLVPRETFWEVRPNWESFHVEQDHFWSEMGLVPDWDKFDGR